MNSQHQIQQQQQQQAFEPGLCNLTNQQQRLLYFIQLQAAMEYLLAQRSNDQSYNWHFKPNSQLSSNGCIPNTNSHSKLTSTDTSYCNQSLNDLSNSPKPRSRTVFSRQQLDRLEQVFEKQRYLTNKERDELSKELGMTNTQIKVWFQNKRNKQKQMLSYIE